MKKFMVTFRWYNTDTYCTNVCLAESEEQARAYYESKYSDVSIRLAFDIEVETAKRKGMPIVTV